MACFWRQVIIVYVGKYVVYLMGEKWFGLCLFPRNHIFPFL